MVALPRSPAASALLAGLSCLLSVGFSIAFLDRGIATWSHEHLRGIRAFVWLTWIAEPILSLAAAGLAGLGIARLLGRRPGAWGWGRPFLACCLATLLASVLKTQLKYCFGRTWPETWIHGNPSWIAQGVFTFQPFHGGAGWASFPSGHMSVAAASMSVLFLSFPRFRWLWISVVVLVAIGLLGADFHWLSDILAGGFLGTLCGWGMVRLLAQNHPNG